MANHFRLLTDITAAETLFFSIQPGEVLPTRLFSNSCPFLTGLHLKG